MPRGAGEAGRRVLFRGGALMTMDRAVGDFAQADVLVSGRTIEAINVAPLNHVPGAVATLMERSNVDTVVAGNIRKRKGTLVDVDQPKLKDEPEASRDHLFAAAGIEKDLFRA